jgi:hypothetical protein
MKINKALFVVGALALAMVVPKTTFALDLNVTAGTSSGLSSAIDSMITKIETMKEGEFCLKISDAVSGLTAAEKASLAWRADSYSKNLTLGVSANATAEEKAEYETLKSAYNKITTSLTADGTISSNDKAAIRGAYLELMAEYRNGTIDNARVEKIRGFIRDAAACVEDGTTVKAAVGSSETETNAVVTVTRDDLIEDDYEFDVPLPASVRTESSLKSYIATNLAHDDNIKSITAESAKTETVYKQDGRLLGFIPVKMNVRSTVNADGTAKVRYPWYKFMTSAVGGKVTSEEILETAMIAKSEKLTITAQAAAIDASIKAFGTAEVE